MIEFYGEISDECKLTLAKKMSKNNGIMFLIATITFNMPLLILGIINGTWYRALPLIAIFALITIGGFITPKNRVLSFKIPMRVIIENDTISITALVGENPMTTKPLEKVKKVVDVGNWYDIIFKFGDITNSWVCQKDLITNGTIEEFEKLFEGKIERQIIKNKK